MSVMRFLKDFGVSLGAVVLLVVMLLGARVIGAATRVELEKSLTPAQMLEFAFRHNAAICELHSNPIHPKGGATKVTYFAVGSKVRLFCEFDEKGRVISFGGNQGKKEKVSYRMSYGKPVNNDHGFSPLLMRRHVHRVTPPPKGALEQFRLASDTDHVQAKYYYVGEGKTSLGYFKGPKYISGAHEVVLDKKRRIHSILTKRTSKLIKQTWSSDKAGDRLLFIDQEMNGVTVRTYTMSKHKFDQHGNLISYTVHRHAPPMVKERVVDVQLEWEF